MIIRTERSGDHRAITDITIAAFENHPYSHHTEQFIIEALRAAGVLTLSLVAEVDGHVSGHIAVSPVTLSDGGRGWYGIGPVSVIPHLQRQGIGKALMNEGLLRIRANGAAGCVLVGDPEYYKQFGFRSYPELTHEGVPQKFVLALPFGENEPRGVAVFHPGFQATE